MSRAYKLLFSALIITSLTNCKTTSSALPTDINFINYKDSQFKDMITYWEQDYGDPRKPRIIRGNPPPLGKGACGTFLIAVRKAKVHSIQTLETVGRRDSVKHLLWTLNNFMWKPTKHNPQLLPAVVKISTSVTSNPNGELPIGCEEIMK